METAKPHGNVFELKRHWLHFAFWIAMVAVAIGLPLSINKLSIWHELTLFVKGKPSSDGSVWGYYPIAWTVCYSFLFYQIVKACCDIGTVFSIGGIRRPGILGSNYIAWVDVTEVKVRYGDELSDIRVISANKKIIIKAWFYADHEQLLTILRRHLPERFSPPKII